MKLSKRLAPARIDWKHGFARRAAEDYLEELGCSAILKPEVEPEMPSDITTLTSEELGTLYARYVAYTGWLEAQLSLVEVDADEQESFLGHIDAKIRLAKTGTVPDKTAKAKNDPEYIAAEQVALIANAKAKLLKARWKGYERCAAALSREMSRRVPLMRND